ncbi:MAG: amidase, partial [Granulosicoccaceae bacterium]
KVNALPIRCFERARLHADELMQKPLEERGILAGLPVPIKDLNNVSGVRTSYGSKLKENNIASSSDLLVENLESNGAIIYAKSNTPEYGAGGNTFNEVLGTTCNPHDLTLSAGGSSGGAAAALASGTAWLAHGSDLAGSLRTPASFCGITSLRPSPGLIASGPSDIPFLVHPQQGPMARDVVDLALFTDAMVGASPEAGLCKPVSGFSFRAAAEQAKPPARVAFSPDLGVAETSPEVLSVCTAAMEKLAADGITITEAHPDLSDAEAAFSAPRALMYSTLLGDDLEKTRQILKPEVVWNTEQGLKLSGDAFRDSIKAQGRVFQQASEFMRDFDLLICPAASIAPYPVELRYPGIENGVPYEEYFRWLAIVYSVTATTLPVITIPCGKTVNGLPVGIQLIGAPHSEKKLFAMASYLEWLLPNDPRPIDPK